MNIYSGHYLCQLPLVSKQLDNIMPAAIKFINIHAMKTGNVISMNKVKPVRLGNKNRNLVASI